MGGALGMVPSKVPIVEPSTCWVLVGKACKVSKDPTLHTMMKWTTKLLRTMQHYQTTSLKELDGWCIGNGPFQGTHCGALHLLGPCMKSLQSFQGPYTPHHDELGLQTFQGDATLLNDKFERG
jgi:hypothetical protein